MSTSHDTIRPIEWTGKTLRLIDQRCLPLTLAHVECASAAEVAAAIRGMVVRGAPAIGIAAAWGVVLAARDAPSDIEPALATLADARPTAVNLAWALARMRAVITGHGIDVIALTREARAIQDEDLAANRRMGMLGAALIAPGSIVLTHCNTGSLATAGFGTALGVIRQGWSEGRLRAVYATETRPWLQGSRLTAWELKQDGIPVTLIADGASAFLMRTRRIDWVIVGADRVAANGDTANKIGTCALAVLARQLGARVMVVAPVSTIDPALPDGAGIPVETRSAEELLSVGGLAVGTPGTAVWNPVFDITPAGLIDALVTERGVVMPPDRAGIVRILAETGSTACPDSPGVGVSI